MRVSGILFLFEQLLCGVCLLSVLSAALGLPRVSVGRTLLFGAVYSLFALLALSLPPTLQLFSSVPLSLLLRLVAGFSARKALPCCLMLLLLQGACAGMAALLPLPGVVQTALSCALLLLLRRLTRLNGVSRRFVRIRIRCGDRSADVVALVDSGNLLCDPISGDPVLVLAQKTFERLTCLPPNGDLLPGMRLIRVRTAAGITWMTIRRPDGILLLSGQKEQALRGLIGSCANSPPLSVLPASMLPYSGLPHEGMDAIANQYLKEE